MHDPWVINNHLFFVFFWMAKHFSYKYIDAMANQFVLYVNFLFQIFFSHFSPHPSFRLPMHLNGDHQRIERQNHYNGFVVGH